MNKQLIANELLKIAKSLMAQEETSEAVKSFIEENEKLADKHLIARKPLKAADEVDHSLAETKFMFDRMEQIFIRGQTYWDLANDFSQDNYSVVLGKKYKRRLEDLQKDLNSLSQGIHDEKHKKDIQDILEAYKIFFKKWTECYKLYEGKLEDLHNSFRYLNKLQISCLRGLEKEIASKKENN